MTGESLFKRLIAERLPAVTMIVGMNGYKHINLNLNGRKENNGKPYIDYTINVDREGVMNITMWNYSAFSQMEIECKLKTEDEVVGYLSKLMDIQLMSDAANEMNVDSHMTNGLRLLER